MVDVLMLCREHGPDRVALSVCGALAAGRTTAAPSRSWHAAPG